MGFLAGEEVTAEDIRSVAYPPFCRLSASAGIALAHGSIVTASWDTLETDTAGMYSAGAPTRISITEAGLYVSGVSFLLSSRADYSRIYAVIRYNGTELSRMDWRWAAINSPGTTLVAQPIPCVVGDYFEVQALQTNAGSAAASWQAVALGPAFFAYKVGGLL